MPTHNSANAAVSVFRSAQQQVHNQTVSCDTVNFAVAQCGLHVQTDTHGLVPLSVYDFEPSLFFGVKCDLIMNPSESSDSLLSQLCGER